MTTLISHAIYVSPLISETQELLGFGLSGEMAEERTDSFCDLSQIWSDQLKKQDEGQYLFGNSTVPKLKDIIGRKSHAKVNTFQRGFSLIHITNYYYTTRLLTCRVVCIITCSNSDDVLIVSTWQPIE